MAKLNPSGSGFIYSTFLGGSDDEGSEGIAVDNSNDAYVTGLTFSTDFITASFKDTLGGSNDAFVSKISDVKPPPYVEPPPYC